MWALLEGWVLGCRPPGGFYWGWVGLRLVCLAVPRLSGRVVGVGVSFGGWRVPAGQGLGGVSLGFSRGRSESVPTWLRRRRNNRLSCGVRRRGLFFFTYARSIRTRFPGFCRFFGLGRAMVGGRKGRKKAPAACRGLAAAVVLLCLLLCCGVARVFLRRLGCLSRGSLGLGVGYYAALRRQEALYNPGGVL